MSWLGGQCGICINETDRDYTGRYQSMNRLGWVWVRVKKREKLLCEFISRIVVVYFRKCCGESDSRKARGAGTPGESDIYDSFEACGIDIVVVDMK